jgi:hypothetical protein
MSNKILQINFKILISPAEYEQANQPYGRVIADIPGLAWKVWLMNESDLEAGGIYLFDDEIALQAFLNGPIVGSLKENPALTDLSLKFFDVLQNLTAETRGPLSIQRG